MKKQKQNAINPITNQEYQVEYPAREEVRQAILNDLEYPPDGITVKEATELLIEKFDLSNEQKNAINRSNLNVFRYNLGNFCRKESWYNLVDQGLRTFWRKTKTFQWKLKPKKQQQEQQLILKEQNTILKFRQRVS